MSFNHIISKSLRQRVTIERPLTSLKKESVGVGERKRRDIQTEGERDIKKREGGLIFYAESATKAILHLAM